MDLATWSFIQQALIYVFEPVIGYWLVGVVFTGVLAALFILVLSTARWLNNKRLI